MPEDAGRRHADGERWNQALAALAELPTRPGVARHVAAIWRQLADEQRDPVRRAEAILNIATALEHGTEDDLEQAIAMSEVALAGLGPKHPEAAAAHLAAVQRIVKAGTRTNRRRALDHLHKALAVPMTAGGRDVLIAMLVRYATVAPDFADFSRLGRAQHIFDRLQKHNLRAHEVWSSYAAMVSLHKARWKAEGHRPSLGRAIQLSAEGLAHHRRIAPEDLAGRAGFLQQRAILLLDRHEHGGGRPDLDAALAALREAAETSTDRAGMLNSLAIALMDHGGDAASDEAQAALQEGLAHSDDDASIAHLNWTMANWHLLAYQRGGPVSHLDQAVEAIERAADHKDLIGDDVLFAVSHAYHDRHRVTRAQDDIDRAVEAAELGLCLTDARNANRWSQEVTAANAYQERALNGLFAFDVADAERAGELYRSALGRLPRDSAQREALAGSAMCALIERFTMDPDPRLIDAAAGLALILPERPDTVGELDALTAVNLATFHLAHGLAREHDSGWLSLLHRTAREHAGDEIGWLAASNLMHRNVGRDWTAVVEAFEVLDSQRAQRLAAAQGIGERAMALRREQSVSAIAGLALVNLGQPDAAVRLLDRSQAALLLGHRADPVGGDNLGGAFDAILYPVSTRYGAYVLTVTSSGMTGRTVPDIEFEFSDQPSPPSPATMESAAAMISAAFPERLPPRLLVVPAGRLGGIPWSAVAHGTCKVVDDSILAVLPTPQLLGNGTAPEGSSALIVDAADALPGSPLRHAAAETSQLRAWMPRGRDLAGTELSSGAVLEALPTSTIAHFACHGVMETEEPTASRLILTADDALRVSDILEVDCSNLSLVVLSACRSAVHGHEMADEFTSLAVAFLVAGAHTVVGTLWNVNDAAASLFSRRLFDTIRSGIAPRDAVRLAQVWLRDSSNGEIADWLTTLGPPDTNAERRLRDDLAASRAIVGFRDVRHWGGFVCYG